MFSRFLSKKNKWLYVSTLIVLALPTMDALAYRQSKNLYGAAAEDTTNNPVGVCVFDLDKTLIKGDYSNDEKDLFDGARAAMQECVDKKFGIAFITARAEKFNKEANVPRLFEQELSADYYKKILENNVYGSYEGVRPTVEYKYEEKGKPARVLPGQRTKFNPLYISYSRPYIKKTGDDGIVYKTILNTKGDGMNRLMRTFYGYGVAEADDTDMENDYANYVIKNPYLDSEGKKRISGCLVLFDDDPENVKEVQHFNIKHNLNFQTFKVNPEEGVALANVRKAIGDLSQTCKKDENAYVKRSRSRD